jgi:uncharacterized protein (TIRG00374 family)
MAFLSTLRQLHTGRRWLWRLLFGLVVAATAIAVLARQVQWEVALAHLREVRPGWLLAAAGCVLTTNIAKALRWRWLFPTDREPPSRRDAFGALMVGQMLNFTLPLRAGDLSRALLMGRYRQASTAAAVGTIGAEKVIDLSIMGLLVALVLPSVILPAWMDTADRGVTIGALVGAGLWIGILLTLPLLQRILVGLGQRFQALRWLSRLVSRFLDGLTALRHTRRVPYVVAWSALAWGCGILTNYLLLRALGLPPSWVSSLLVILIIQGGVSVPLAPGQIGVFEALAVLALSLTGIPAEAGLAFGIWLHIIVMGIPVLSSVWWLSRRG